MCPTTLVSSRHEIRFRRQNYIYGIHIQQFLAFIMCNFVLAENIAPPQNQMLNNFLVLDSSQIDLRCHLMLDRFKILGNNQNCTIIQRTTHYNIQGSTVSMYSNSFQGIDYRGLKQKCSKGHIVILMFKIRLQDQDKVI